MTRKQALGRGLSALLPGPRETPRAFSGAQEVEIARLVPGRFQPRHGGSAWHQRVRRGIFLNRTR